jgi:hypothetical protein
MSVWTLLRVAFSIGLGPTKRGIPGAVGKEALLMRENKAQGHNSEKRSRCEINHLFDGASCVEAAKTEVDGLVLCERHALEAKLEGQIKCWGGMLFHIDLWSREASRQKRPDVVRLLEDQRTQATSAIERATEDLELVRNVTPWEYRRGLSRRDSLPLPPTGARPLARGLGRLRRR